MTSLKDINFGMNQYCGPAVISALTGLSTDECASAISRVTGKQVIKAVAVADLVKTFKLLRFTCEPVKLLSYTLFGNLNNLSDKDGFYIVIVPKHVVAVEIKNNEIFLVDNASKSPLKAEASARLTQKVECIYKVTPKSLPVLLRTEICVKHLVLAPKKVIIKVKHIFERSEDDSEGILGEFIYRDEEQLNSIITELTKLRREW